ncbi:MAG TPA: uroporphyrinogen-III synthase [Sphingomicrobium sp.]|nr:uroporphyrinogen-III synthase [Sphingomicrobium sp.]
MFVLRPEPGASATVERARERGLRAVAAPLFEIERVPWEAPQAAGFDGLLLTSAKAVRCAGEKLNDYRSLKAFAVGGATADAARQAGFDVAMTGEGGVEQLLDSMEAEFCLLHLCGEDRTNLPRKRQSIIQRVVYRSREIDAPDLGGIGGSVALVHSPRAALRFAELVRERESISIAAISMAAASAAGPGWECVKAAPKPSDDALLALAALLCNNSPPE